MCTCILDVEIKILAKVKETVAGEIKYGKLLQTHFPFNKGQLKSRVTYTDFQYELAPLKKDGTIGKLKKQSIGISHAYCPFCGEKYDSSK